MQEYSFREVDMQKVDTPRSVHRPKSVMWGFPSSDPPIICTLYRSVLCSGSVA